MSKIRNDNRKRNGRRPRTRKTLSDEEIVEIMLTCKREPVRLDGTPYHLLDVAEDGTLLLCTFVRDPETGKRERSDFAFYANDPLAQHPVVVQRDRENADRGWED